MQFIYFVTLPLDPHRPLYTEISRVRGNLTRPWCRIRVRLYWVHPDNCDKGDSAYCFLFWRYCYSHYMFPALPHKHNMTVDALNLSTTTHLPSNTLCFKAVCHNIPNAQPSELATQPWPESKHKQRFKFAPKLSTLCAKRDPSRCPVHIGFVVTTNISCWNVAMCMCERFFVW